MAIAKLLKNSPRFLDLDDWLIGFMRTWGITLLRTVLGVVYVWFGALKLAGVSPVQPLIENSYWFFPQPSAVITIGVLEVMIGLGFLFKVWLKLTILLLWLQMAGVMFTPVLAPYTFFTGGNPLLLTTEGEFIVKNLVFITASLVIGGYLCKPYRIKSTA